MDVDDYVEWGTHTVSKENPSGPRTASMLVGSSKTTPFGGFIVGLALLICSSLFSFHNTKH